MAPGFWESACPWGGLPGCAVPCAEANEIKTLCGSSAARCANKIKAGVAAELVKCGASFPLLVVVFSAIDRGLTEEMDYTSQPTPAEYEKADDVKVTEKGDAWTAEEAVVPLSSGLAPGESGYRVDEMQTVCKRSWRPRRNVPLARRRRILRRLQAKWQAEAEGEKMLEKHVAWVRGEEVPQKHAGGEPGEGSLEWEGAAKGKYNWGESSTAASADNVGGEAITKYSWSDGKEQVSIYIELDGLDDVDEGALSTESGERSVSFTFVSIGGQRRCFQLANLAHGISEVRMQRMLGRNQVVLKLLKKEQQTWSSLTEGCDGGMSGDDDDDGGWGGMGGLPGGYEFAGDPEEVEEAEWEDEVEEASEEMAELEESYIAHRVAEEAAARGGRSCRL